MIKNFFLAFFLFSFLLTSNSKSLETKSAEEVFKNSTSKLNIKKKNIIEFTDNFYINHLLDLLPKEYNESPVVFGLNYWIADVFLNFDYGNIINNLNLNSYLYGSKKCFSKIVKNFYTHKTIINSSANKLTEKFYKTLITKNKNELISFLKKRINLKKVCNFLSQHFGYTILFEVLSQFSREILRNDCQLEFSNILSNDIIKHCFYQKNFKEFEKKCISKEENIYILGFILSIIKTGLSEYGWRYWLPEPLEDLRKSRKEIVYIGGGTDIYWLIAKSGKKDIKVIDPLYFEKKGPFYVKGAKWLYKGKVGDKITFSSLNSNPTLELQRCSFKESKKNIHSKSNIKRGVSGWKIIKNGKEKGKIIFKRRLCKQSDFAYSRNKKIVMSFSELIHVVDGTWGININQFDPRTSITVRQLFKPLNRQTLKNIKCVQRRFPHFYLG